MTHRVELDELMLTGAVRYALGRSSYIVTATCREVRTVWPQLSRGAKACMIRDVDREMKYAVTAGSTVGMRWDDAEWRDLLSWMRRQEGWTVPDDEADAGHEVGSSDA